MHFFLDLRYFFPPLINLAILLLASQTDAVSLQLVIASMEFDEYPILKLASLALAIFSLLVFLFTPVKLHLSASPITVETGYFSGPLTFLVLASIILRPNLFWIVYFMIIITSPWRGLLWELEKCFFKSFVVALKSIPTLVITCTQQQISPEPDATQSTSGLVAVDFVVDVEGN